MNFVINDSKRIIATCSNRRKFFRWKPECAKRVSKYFRFFSEKTKQNAHIRFKVVKRYLENFTNLICKTHKNSTYFLLIMNKRSAIMQLEIEKEVLLCITT